MFKSLFARLVTILLVLIIGLGVFFILLSLFTTDSYFYEVNQNLNHDLAEHLVAEWDLLRDGEINQEHMSEVFHTLMIANPSIECYLLDNEGRVIAYNAPEEKIKRRSVDLQPVQSFIRAEDRGPILGDDPRSATRRKAFSAAPILVDGRREGYLYVILGGEDYENVADMIGGSVVINLSFWVALASLAVAVLVGVLSFGLLTQRLRRLIAAVNAFRGSGFTHIEPAALPAREKGDEIDQLASDFKRMAGRITEHIDKLKTIDSERREMVGSVSHDLRAPLTTLQGHLETMLVKEKQLDEKDRRGFLEAAISSCRRLAVLVEDLFELAKLDSYAFKPQLESFSLDDLAHDIVQKYSLAADEQGLSIDIKGCDDPCIVRADAGLIERALDNLIGNSLKYTPAGGSVMLRLSCDRSAVRLEVTDTGTGISPEDQPHIFEKFYRSFSPQSASIGSGLGLAIVRRIAELHGGSVEVESEPGRGSTFTLTLAAA